MRYLIRFSYDGTNYNGYQKQIGYSSIEESIENALTFINNKKETKLNSSGRTDKGVHAINQCAHFDLDVNITIDKLKRAINSNIPEDIHVNSVEEVDKDFHARYNVKEKTYKYILNMGEYNPLERLYVYQFNQKLDVDSMKEAIKDFVGEHDFSSFTPERDKKTNCVRKIRVAKIELDKENKDKLIFTFTGNGFIKYQIRNMVGYLIWIGLGKKDKNSIKDVLLEKNRKFATITAHPEGLYLVDVKY